MSKHHSDFKVLDAAVLKQLQSLQVAQSIFEKYIDPSWIGQCQLTPFNAPQLTVIVDHSSLATRFRTESTKLIAELAKEPCFQGIKSIHCKINQHLRFKKMNGPKPLSWKSEHKETILSVASSIPDEKIKAILKRLVDESAGE